MELPLFDFSKMNVVLEVDSRGKKGKKKEILNDVSSRMLKIRTKIQFDNKLKRECVDKLINALPLENESLHIVSNGSFDYFTLIPKIIDLSGKNADLFYFSTWTMSHNNCIQIFDLFDAGKIKTICALTGEYFKTRESAVYAILVQGVVERGQKVFANKNHSKVTLIQCDTDYYIVEGSANFTANPRIEQFIITNSKPLFEFHKSWMDELLKNKEL